MTLLCCGVAHCGCSWSWSYSCSCSCCCCRVVQKRSEHVMSFTFWLRRVRDRQFLTLFTSKCASRHNGVHFFDSPTAKSAPELKSFLTFWLPSLLRAITICNFWSLISPDGSAPAASLLFDSPEPQIIGITQRFATFLPFRAPASSLLLTLSLLWSSFLSLSFLWLFPPLLFHLSILSEDCLPNFLRGHLNIYIYIIHYYIHKNIHIHI